MIVIGFFYVLVVFNNGVVAIKLPRTKTARYNLLWTLPVDLTRPNKNMYCTTTFTFSYNKLNCDVMLLCYVGESCFP